MTRSQLSLAHNAKVKTDMPEKNEKHLESVDMAIAMYKQTALAKPRNYQRSQEAVG